MNINISICSKVKPCTRSHKYIQQNWKKEKTNYVQNLICDDVCLSVCVENDISLTVDKGMDTSLMVKFPKGLWFFLINCTRFVKRPLGA